eukprot:CAMPEP_0198330956 /NCGR_PEP_ID=MMETSP1450-20131203/17256_1 /TAXON_ID=753684 ORGANISM="Madagascaria erythrocladiodes, Strain CCMP3234" /NCGR_SAMPLE_ID=MMETSP1450 /ASSEMBLY_ACC=CAM_ASM_001115 /LENGTH=328 /DNA_ID=CAMNT_0044035293 /DNA_START=146 /DNA_END=1132 /DNA_ORIENTATION=-
MASVDSAVKRLASRPRMPRSTSETVPARRAGPTRRTTSSMGAPEGPPPPLPAPPAVSGLAVVDYHAGQVTWGAQVFGVLHNAVRKELRDLYAVMLAVHTRKGRTARHEDLALMDWWAVFRIFFREYVTIEDNILFKLVSTEGLSYVQRREVDMLMNALKSARLELLTHFRQLTDVCDRLFVTPLIRLLPELFSAFALFAEATLAYFTEQERRLPPHFEWCHASSTRADIDQRIYEHMARGKYPHTNLVILTQWMDPRELLDWKRTHLKGYAKKMTFGKWEADFLRTHKKTVEEFHVSSAPAGAMSKMRRSTSGSSGRGGGPSSEVSPR